MTPLKTSVLIFLILGAFCQSIAAFYPSHPKACCYEYRTGGPLPIARIARYWKTPGDCSRDAVVFAMKSGKTICVNPRESWVKKTLAILKNRK